MQILVLNAGSSSIKYKLFEMEQQQEIASGLFDRIGAEGSNLEQRWTDASGEARKIQMTSDADGHGQAMEVIMHQLQESGVLSSPQSLAAIGHRVVHGGEAFKQPAIIDGDTLQAIEKMVPLAPLHNPANLEGIKVAMALCPHVPQIAVFDTAFHQTMPEVAFRYAIPETLYREHYVRRYGFHGTSHHFVVKQAAVKLGKPLEQTSMITLHLGNGCSAAAILNGQCVDTSMGMTPLEGLVMGTRSGDIDPALHFYLQREAGFSSEEVETLLNKDSGLKGLCNVSDMREIQALADSGDAAATLAEQIFVYRIKKYIGAYLAVLGKIDALVFTGGIGENSSRIREQVCKGLSGLGIAINSEYNNTVHGETADISNGGTSVLVIPTNEELEIAESTCALISD